MNFFLQKDMGYEINTRGLMQRGNEQLNYRASLYSIIVERLLLFLLLLLLLL